MKGWGPTSLSSWGYGMGDLKHTCTHRLTASLHFKTNNILMKCGAKMWLLLEEVWANLAQSRGFLDAARHLPLHTSFWNEFCISFYRRITTETFILIGLERDWWTLIGHFGSVAFLFSFFWWIKLAKWLGNRLSILKAQMPHLVVSPFRLRLMKPFYFTWHQDNQL